MTSSLPRTPIAAEWALTAIDDQPAFFLAVLKQAAPGDFWPIFLQWYPQLTQPWRVKKKLLELLRAAGDATQHHPVVDRAFLNGLPIYNYVFRGAPSRHREGLEWFPTYQAAEACARQAKATWSSGSVYEGLVGRNDIFAILSTDRGEQTLIVDYERVSDRRIIKPDDVRSRDNFIPRPYMSADEMRRFVLQPAHTDGGKSWESNRWIPTPGAMLAAADDTTLASKLDDAQTRLAAAHLKYEILSIENEIRGIRGEQAWRSRNPGKDSKRRYRGEKSKAKGKSTGRPKSGGEPSPPGSKSGKK